MSRDDILKRLDAEFDSLLKSIDGLSDEQMTTVWFGEWGVRDILAHVAGWHWEMTGAFQRIAKGERPVPEGVDYNDADSWNARFSGDKREIDPDEVVEDLIASKGAFVAAARNCPKSASKKARPPSASSTPPASTTTVSTSRKSASGASARAYERRHRP